MIQDLNIPATAAPSSGLLAIPTDPFGSVWVWVVVNVRTIDMSVIGDFALVPHPVQRRVVVHPRLLVLEDPENPNVWFHIGLDGDFIMVDLHNGISGI